MPSDYVKIALESGHRNNEVSHFIAWWCSILMFVNVYQRVRWSSNYISHHVLIKQLTLNGRVQFQWLRNKLPETSDSRGIPCYLHHLCRGSPRSCAEVIASPRCAWRTRSPCWTMAWFRSTAAMRSCCLAAGKAEWLRNKPLLVDDAFSNLKGNLNHKKFGNISEYSW